MPFDYRDVVETLKKKPASLRRRIGAIDVSRDVDDCSLEPWQQELREDERDAIRRTSEKQDRDQPLVLAVITESLPGSRRKATPKKGRSKNPLVAARKKLIRQVSEKLLQGEAYCRELERLNFSTPMAWQKRDGCPASYLQAWNYPNIVKRAQFRQWITDEKSKATSGK